MKQTAIQNLKEDLILTKVNVEDSLSEIKNQDIKDACIKVVEMTLNNIIKRIDDELLEIEKEQKIEFAKKCLHKNDCFFDIEQYYNETFKSE